MVVSWHLQVSIRCLVQPTSTATTRTTVIWPVLAVVAVRQAHRQPHSNLALRRLLNSILIFTQYLLTWLCHPRQRRHRRTRLPHRSSPSLTDTLTMTMTMMSDITSSVFNRDRSLVNRLKISPQPCTKSSVRDRLNLPWPILLNLCNSTISPRAFTRSSIFTKRFVSIKNKNLKKKKSILRVSLNCCR